MSRIYRDFFFAKFVEMKTFVIFCADISVQIFTWTYGYIDKDNAFQPSLPLGMTKR
jgi:hypothetical protein